jgi:probable HAF family extracellular repeat protein
MQSPPAQRQVCGIMEDLGGLLGGRASATVDLTADGQMVLVGPWMVDQKEAAVLWSPGGPVRRVPAPDMCSHNLWHGISGDGQTIVGGVRDAYELLRVARWSACEGATLVPTGMTYFASAVDVNHDGRVIVGYAQRNQEQARLGEGAFRYDDDGGMVYIFPFPHIYSAANAVSADGGVIVGAANHRDARGVWAFRWTFAEGASDLGGLGGTYTVAYDVSADGSVIVGIMSTTDRRTLPFRWTRETGMVSLGTLGGSSGEAMGVSGDGRVVVGRAHNAANQLRAFRWTAESGMTDLGTLGGPESQAHAVSHDGSVIAGTSKAIDGMHRAFRWTLTPCPCPAMDFDGDGLFPHENDTLAALTLLTGGPCNACPPLVATGANATLGDQDVIDFFNVLAGGTCP